MADSGSNQLPPSVPAAAGESSSTASFNGTTANHERTRPRVQSQARHVPAPSPALADTVVPAEPKATTTGTVSSLSIDDEPAPDPQVAQSRGPRFPKLIVIEQGGKSIVAPIQNQNRLGDEHVDGVGSPSLARPVSNDPETRRDGFANQIAFRNSLEPRPEQTQSLEPVSSSVRSEVAPEHARSHRTSATHRLAEPVAKVPLVRTHAEETDESVTWPIPTRGKTEEPSSRSLPDSQPQHGESTPKLTINRLDVQIVNQPPAAPAPVAPAPPSVPSPTDSWERLERHLLGRLDLIF
ncbi:MAG TPA: hypothetical protein VFR51_19870 [Pyrinomonadaceae bacterium]|nr:hypothetical protein [Pyrinomonadaceae bacterium]